MFLIATALLGFRAAPTAPPIVRAWRHQHVVAQEGEPTNEMMMASLKSLLTTVTKLEEKEIDLDLLEEKELIME